MVAEIVPAKPASPQSHFLPVKYISDYNIVLGRV